MTTDLLTTVIAALAIIGITLAVSAAVTVIRTGRRP